MSLKLSFSKPQINVKTFEPKTVFLGDYEISLTDFLETCEYVLTNTDLEPNDPRLKFVERVRNSEVVGGFLIGGRRIILSES